MILSRKELLEGSIIPKYYGLAYRDYHRGIIVAYPMPLHFAVSLLRRFWQFYMRYFKIPKCKPSAIDRLIIQEKIKSGALIARRLRDNDNKWIELFNRFIGG